MEEGSRIKVTEEGKVTRLVMPISPPPRVLSRAQWINHRLGAWVTVLVLTIVVLWVGWLVVGKQAKMPPNERWKWQLLGLVEVGAVIALVRHILLMMIAKGEVFSGVSQDRVEVVVDRRGVTQRGQGQRYSWRVPLKKVGALVVCKPLGKWPEQTESEWLATVRIVGKNGVGARRTIWGAYEPAVAVEAAVALMQQIERVRSAEGVSGWAMVMRDERGVLPREGDPEQLLESGWVRFERTSEGVRMELKPWLKEVSPRIDEDYLVSVNAMGMLYGFLLLVGGGMAGAVIAEFIGKKQGVLNVVGIVVALSSIVGGFLWAYGAWAGRVSYAVGSTGVERSRRMYGLAWKRRWKREEIEGVFRRSERWSEGRSWEAGIRERGGREVVFATGWRWTVEAFATVVERELGIEKEQ